VPVVWNDINPPYFYMTDFRYLFCIQENHDIGHNGISFSIGLREYLSLHSPDKSCIICYPPNRNNNLAFQNFWDWHSAEYPTQSYTSYTQTYFAQLETHNPNLLPDELVRNLFVSIRYTNLPGYYPQVLNQFLEAYL
jgi:hypothetical protein